MFDVVNFVLSKKNRSYLQIKKKMKYNFEFKTKRTVQGCSFMDVYINIYVDMYMEMCQTEYVYL